MTNESIDEGDLIVKSLLKYVVTYLLLALGPKLITVFKPVNPYPSGACPVLLQI